MKSLVPGLGDLSTQDWIKGASLFNQDGTPTQAFWLIPTGTAVATFGSKGKVYKSSDPRSTHGAIFLFTGSEKRNGVWFEGFWVIDQWAGRGHAGIRFIAVQGAKLRSNDAREFSVVMIER